MADAARIRRGFADLAHGQLHYRAAGGKGAPLLAIHASPGSSRQLSGLIADFAGEAMVFAPDTPGNGDSEPLPGEVPDIARLAAVMAEYIDGLGLDTVRVYGSHTGAAIAAELAILAPDRVSHLVLDGVSLFEGAMLEEVLARYARPFEPDLDGAYLMRLFQFCRDQYLFFPWYERTRAARRDGGLGSAEDLHAWVTEVMKAATTYHVNYHAAFQWPANLRLPLVACPTLVMAAANDPLNETSRDLARLLSDGRFSELPRFDAHGFRAARRDTMTALFKGYETP